MKRFALPALQGLVFGTAMFLVSSGNGSALRMAIFSGAAFAAFMTVLIVWRDKRGAKVRAPYEAEGIVHDGPANHASNGGWLVLTKQRLVFEPHKLNFSSKRTELGVDDIAGARPGDGVLPNKIVVVTRSNQSLQFVVNGRSAWLAKLPGVKRDA